MLDKLSSVTLDGKFKSEIENDDYRFAIQLSSLSEGRITVIGISPRVLLHGLKIALRFSAMRRQFAKPGEKIETPLIEYPLHQFRLFPYVAKGVGYLIASQRVF